MTLSLIQLGVLTFILQGVSTATGNDDTTSLETTPEVNRTSSASKIPLKAIHALAEAAAFNPELRNSVDRLLNPNNTLDIMTLADAASGVSDVIQAAIGGSPPQLAQLLQPVLGGSSSTGSPLSVLEVNESTWAQFFEDSPNGGGRCSDDLFSLVTGLRNPLNSSNMWALAMLDASGKPGPSILKGNHKFLGNYQQCRDVVHNNFTGHTCRARVVTSIGPVAFGSNPAVPALEWDFCLPNSCNGPEVTHVLENVGSNINVTVECTPEFDLSSDIGAIVCIVILSIFGVLAVVGTFLDVYIQLKKDDTFPVYKNMHENVDIELRKSDIKRESTNKLSRKPSIKANPLSETTMEDITNRVTVPGMMSDVVPQATQSDFRDFSKRLSFRAQENGTLPPPNIKPVPDAPKRIPKWQQALLSFSLPKNTDRIFSTNAGRGNIGCLHGIRVLSMAWVVLGHHVSMGTRDVIDPANFIKLVSTLPFQIIINAPLAVDSFFFLSGFLTGYLFLKECWNKGVKAKTMALYYFHRYWRLTPPMMVAVMITATLIKYVGEGLPLFHGSPEQKYCQDNWWVNLLYINTLIKDQKQGLYCVSDTWFLSCDMIYYVMAPLILVPLVYKLNVLGFLVSAVLIGIHLASNIWLEEKYNFDMFRDQPEYLDKLYFRPWARVAPYVIGLIFGWSFFKLNGKIKLNKVLVALGWILAIGLAFTITLVTYDDNNVFANIFTTGEWPMEARLVHESLSRPLWAVVLGWIVLACSSGYGGFINSILSWEGFLPLSRLTYGAYLCHWLVLNFETEGTVWNSMFSLDLLIYQFFGFYIVSYAVAFLLSVFVEMPLIALEKVLLK